MLYKSGPDCCLLIVFVTNTPAEKKPNGSLGKEMTSNQKSNPTKSTAVTQLQPPCRKKLKTGAICQPRPTAPQTNVAKGETFSVMDSAEPNEMLLL